MRTLLSGGSPVRRRATLAQLRACGGAVDTADDDVDALWLAREHPYDLVVLDVVDRPRSAPGLCVRLREAAIWSPVLVLGPDDDRTHVACLDAGADDYLTAPPVLAVLAARIRALRRGAAVPRPSVLRCGDVALDPATRQVRVGDRPVPLTAKEVTVLEHLLRRAGTVVGKRQLFAHAWEDACASDPTLVEVYIHRLRRRLRAAGATSEIRTLRGSGYLLVAGGSQEPHDPGGPARPRPTTAPNRRTGPPSADVAVTAA